MARIEMYVTPTCHYCMRAKALFEKKGVTWETIDIRKEPARRKEMLERTEGRRTVPQIFIDGKSVGGFDEIAELDRKGELDPLLGIS